MYLKLPIQVPYTCLCPQQWWHVHTYKMAMELFSLYHLLKKINHRSYLAGYTLGFLHPLHPMKIWNLHNSFTRRTEWWKKWDTTYVVVKIWTSKRDDEFIYNLSYRKRSQLITMIRRIGRWDTLPRQPCLIRKKNPIALYHRILQTHQIRSQMSVRELCLRTSPSTWLWLVRWKRIKMRGLNHSTRIHGLSNLTTNGKCVLNNVNLSLKKNSSCQCGWSRTPKANLYKLQLSPIERQNLISLIREYVDVFAWSY